MENANVKIALKMYLIQNLGGLRKYKKTSA
jgi:hypothetical protein